MEVMMGKSGVLTQKCVGWEQTKIVSCDSWLLCCSHPDGAGCAAGVPSTVQPDGEESRGAGSSEEGKSRARPPNLPAPYRLLCSSQHACLQVCVS
eukprot:215268-Rhodomonas_salina.1